MHDNQMQTLRSGHEFYTIGTGVDDDKVVLRLVSKDLSTATIQGNTRQVRLTGQLAIAFPRGYLATAPADDVLRRIKEVIRTQAEAAAPRTVALGQTRAEVESVLRAPTSMVDLGARVMLIYTAMKVILQDGKVSDLQ